DERECLDVLYNEVGQEVSLLGGGGTAHGGALLAAQNGKRRLPERVSGRAAWGGIVIDGDDVQSGEAGRCGGGLRRSGGGKDEGRVGAVAGAQPAQAAQDLRDVRAEHAPVSVRLIDDHVAEAPQEGRPAGVA